MNFLKKIINKESGFTLVELLITITLGITMATVGFTSYQGFKARKDVELTTAEIAAAIENTRQRSVTQEDGSAWGIRFNSVADGQDNYEIFKGSTYATSSVVSLSSLRSSLDFTKPSSGESLDLSFAPIHGTLDNKEIISITSGSGRSYLGDIIVSQLGRVTDRIEDDLVGYWHFDEGTGSDIFDASGKGNDGSVTGASWQSAGNCIVGTCLDFDGSNDGILIEDFPLIFDDSVSLSAWVYYNDDSRGILFGNYDSFNEINFEKHTSRRLRLYWNGGERDVFSDDNAFSLNEWNHVVIIRNKQLDRIEFWVNGVLDRAVANAGTDITSTSQTFRIGRDSRTGSTVTDGKIDEVKIYDRALSESEINKMYNDFK